MRRLLLSHLLVSSVEELVSIRESAIIPSTMPITPWRNGYRALNLRIVKRHGRLERSDAPVTRIWRDLIRVNSLSDFRVLALLVAGLYLSTDLSRRGVGS